MLAVVKELDVEMMLSGADDDVAEIIEILRQEFTVEVLHPFNYDKADDQDTSC